MSFWKARDKSPENLKAPEISESKSTDSSKAVIISLCARRDASTIVPVIYVYVNTNIQPIICWQFFDTESTASICDNVLRLIEKEKLVFTTSEGYFKALLFDSIAKSRMSSQIITYHF